jgi:4-aminobutyrate---pyruvate transaminase
MNQIVPGTGAAPGNSAASRDIAHFLHPYTNLTKHREVGPMIIERGKGVYVYDDAGKEYIEGLAGLWCASFGFGEEALIEAAVQQMRRLPYYHTFAAKSHHPGIDLAEKLKAIAPVPMSKVFFANSGSEANDSAVKMIWYYNNAKGRPKKKKILGRIKGYHGVTVASASLTGLPNNHREWDLPLPGFIHADCPHYYRFGAPGETEEQFTQRLAESLEKQILAEGPDTVAAMFAEPIMGAGGVLVPPAGYFPAIQPILKKYDILLVADEVICGFGRTGNMWGTQTFGMQPDILTCAKALSSAYLPISAVMISEDVYQGMCASNDKVGVFAHGYTYSAHPVPAAVAVKTLELMESRKVVDHVREVAPHFQKQLHAFADHPLVGEARGVGLIGATELVADKATKRAFDPKLAVGTYLVNKAQEHGLVLRAMGDSVGFCPPLIITRKEIDALFDRYAKALDETEAWVKSENLRAAA